MRALWVDGGNDCDWAKASAHKMTALYYPANDPPADVRRRIGDTRQHLLYPGLFAAWNWWPALDGGSFAEKVHSLVTTCTPVGTPAPKVQLDMETHDPAYILEALRRFRALRPVQDTCWTLEGGQGGWMTPAFVAEVISLRVRISPQLYDGSMTEVWDSLAFARDLTKRGFPDSLITPFWDAAHLPVAWNGWAFSQGRLP